MTRPAAPAWCALAALLVATPAKAQLTVIESEPAPKAAAARPAGAEPAAALARAQARGALTLRARDVRVQGRWTARLPPPLERCALLTPQSISDAMTAVRLAFTAPDAELRAAGSSAEVEVFWVDVDFVDQRPGVPGECGGAPTIDVVLRPLHLRVPTERLGDNVLPLARTALGTAYREVPATLRALNPALTLSHDRAAGTQIGAALRAPMQGALQGTEAHAGLRKSLDADLHDAAAGLDWRLSTSAGDALVTEYRLQLAGDHRRVPLGDGVLTSDSTRLGGGVTLRLAPTSRLWLDAGWQSAGEQLEAAGVVSAAPRETHRQSRAMADLLMPDTLTYLRAALWHERAGGVGTVAAALGAAREFRLRPGLLLGVEASMQIGHMDAAAPPQRRFRGGPPPAQLLYDGPQTPGLLALPTGPVLRSFGTAQAQLGSGAAARGGTRFWSASLNVAFPVARWYRPLIPDESTGLQIADDQPPVTIKQMLMTQVNVTGPNMLAANLMSQGMPAAEAHKQAQASLAQVQPAVRYLVEDAPIFAVRPLLMIDAAGLADGGAGADAHARWLAVGAGAQVQLATARFDLGYMRTVSGPVTRGGRGALVLRLSFQNLF